MFDCDVIWVVSDNVFDALIGRPGILHKYLFVP